MVVRRGADVHHMVLDWYICHIAVPKVGPTWATTMLAMSPVSTTVAVAVMVAGPGSPITAANQKAHAIMQLPHSR